MKIIVGLGNPGITYERTRHNVGFLVLDRLAELNHIFISTKRFKSLYGVGRIDSERLILIKPMTLMNRSGDAVKKVLHFFQAGIEDLIVIHDDLDLPFGRLRFKLRGGDGGHQGVRSIIESIGQSTFLRFKIGIGRPPRGMDPADYVLTPFDEIQYSDLLQIVSRAAEALNVVVFEGIDTAMNRYQRKSTPLFQSP